MLTRTTRSLLVAALVGALLAPAPARAHHIGGAIYVGRLEGGGRVEITVAWSGREIDRFLATDIRGRDCSFNGLISTTADIRNHSFTSRRYEGTFSDPGRASGTLRIKTKDCDTGTLEWSATRREAHHLSVESLGSGRGKVTIREASPFPSGCRDCRKRYPEGRRLVLKADPGPHSRFTGWSGACSGTDKCRLQMDSDKTVRATFVALRRLTVYVDGTGAGTVTASRVGLNCPENCAQRYRKGATVDLTPSPAAGSVFAGWVGACSGMAECSIRMNTRRRVIATFDLKSGGGGGGGPDYRGFWVGATAQGHDVELTILKTTRHEIADLQIAWSRSKCTQFVGVTFDPRPEIEPNGDFSRAADLERVPPFTFSGTFKSETEAWGHLEVGGRGDCGGVNTVWSALKT